MNGLVTIFVMPQEIDDLHITLLNLKRNVAALPTDIQLDLHLTLCVSDELTDWSSSKLSKEYVLSKFETILPLCDWSKNPVFIVEDGNSIIGCVSQRRFTLQNSNGYDFVIWLDTDLFFNDTTFLYLIETFRAINNPVSIVTPQFVRQWDPTWDMLVNSHYLNKPLMYHEAADIFSIALMDHGDIVAGKLDTFKFAGGWCTLIGTQLLNLIGIPDSFGHYGLEDTYVVECCKIAQSIRHSSNPVQYVVQNLVIGENYKYRCNNHLKEFITSKNRKEEFRKIATDNFERELMTFKRKLTNE
jgi:hypothetical protein